MAQERRDQVKPVFFNETELNDDDDKDGGGMMFTYVTRRRLVEK